MDSLRADHLGCYGYERNTSPAVDAFAAGAVRFDQAIASGSWTQPSIMSMMTSVPADVHQRVHWGRSHSTNVVTLAETLQKAGYQTVGLVANASRRDWFVAAVGSAFLAVVPPLFFADPNAPRVRDGCVVSGGEDAPLVLYDRSWKPRTILPYLPEGYVLPLAPGDRSGDFSRIWYFGDAAEYSANHPAARHTFFFPSEFFQPPPGTEHIIAD